MSVEAPKITRHGGLSDFLSKVEVGVDWINKITTDESTITNPNSTNQQRVDAYSDFVTVYNQSGSFSTTAQGIASNIKGLLQTYMQSIVITVQNPGGRYDGCTPVPLMNPNNQQATLWDLVNAMNNNDGAQDFTVSGNLDHNYSHYNINPNVDWLDQDQLHSDIDGCSNRSETASNGINWQETGDYNSFLGGGNSNIAVTAQGTVKQWLPYATASKTGGTADDLAAVEAAINSVTH